MRQASAATADSATSAAAAMSSPPSASSSHGLAIARKRPRQNPSWRSSVVVRALSSEPEAVTELRDDCLEVGGLITARLVADQLTGRHVALLLVVLQPHAPFPATGKLV